MSLVNKAMQIKLVKIINWWTDSKRKWCRGVPMVSQPKYIKIILTMEIGAKIFAPRQFVDKRANLKIEAGTRAGKEASWFEIAYHIFNLSRRWADFIVKEETSTGDNFTRNRKKRKNSNKKHFEIYLSRKSLKHWFFSLNDFIEYIYDSKYTWKWRVNNLWVNRWRCRATFLSSLWKKGKTMIDSLSLMLEELVKTIHKNSLNLLNI